MQRLGLLDGLRGYFLVFMLLNHLSFEGGYQLVRINHAQLGFVQDAQGFVFLSGLLIGLVYGKRMLKRGFDDGARKVWYRSAELYAYALGCIVLVLALMQVLPHAKTYWAPWLAGLAGPDRSYLVGAALLLYQPTYMDILPQYIAYLIVAPPLVWLCVTGRWLSVAIGSALLWFAVQIGLHLPLAAALNAALGLIHEPLGVRAHFNILAWQVVFMSGLVMGALTARGEVDWKAAFDPKRTEWALVALAFVIFFAGLRLAITFGLITGDMLSQFQQYENRSEFGTVFLVNFVALAYLVAWLLIAGPRSDKAWVRRIGQFLTALFSLSFLRLLGRHSLQVYAWHVIVVYVFKGIDFHHGPFGEGSKTAIALIGIALLALPALWREVRASMAARAKETRDDHAKEPAGRAKPA